MTTSSRRARTARHRLNCPTRGLVVTDFPIAPPYDSETGGADFTDCPLARAYPRRLLTVPRPPRCIVEPFGPTIAAPRRKTPV
jgi:hypothetical protein